jgi:hypothetical protein
MQSKNDKVDFWLNAEFNLYILTQDQPTEKDTLEGIYYRLPTDKYFAMRDSLHNTNELNRCTWPYQQFTS